MFSEHHGWVQTGNLKADVRRSFSCPVAGCNYQAEIHHYLIDDHLRETHGEPAIQCPYIFMSGSTSAQCTYTTIYYTSFRGHLRWKHGQCLGDYGGMREILEAQRRLHAPEPAHPAGANPTFTLSTTECSRSTWAEPRTGTADAKPSWPALAPQINNMLYARPDISVDASVKIEDTASSTIPMWGALEGAAHRQPVHASGRASGELPVRGNPALEGSYTLDLPDRCAQGSAAGCNGSL